jgi:hypothetical protein
MFSEKDVILQALRVDDATLVAAVLAVDNAAMATFFAAMSLIPAEASAKETPSREEPFQESACCGGDTAGTVLSGELSGKSSADTLLGSGANGGVVKGSSVPSPRAAQSEWGWRKGICGVGTRLVQFLVATGVAAWCCKAGEALAVATGVDGFGLAFTALIVAVIAAAHDALTRRWESGDGATELTGVLARDLFSGNTLSCGG